MCWLVRRRCGTDSSRSTFAWAAPLVHSERWMQYPRRRPIASSIMGFEDEWNNLLGVLAVNLTAGPSDQTNSPHPSSREGHHSTVGWISVFLLSDLILYGSHAAATSRVQRNSVPSTHMRCMIMASRRASATIAFFIPRCLAIFIAQALSQDHFVERTSMLWAAS